MFGDVINFFKSIFSTENHVQDLINKDEECCEQDKDTCDNPEVDCKDSSQSIPAETVEVKLLSSEDLNSMVKKDLFDLADERGVSVLKKDRKDVLIKKILAG